MLGKRKAPASRKAEKLRRHEYWPWDLPGYTKPSLLAAPLARSWCPTAILQEILEYADVGHLRKELDSTEFWGTFSTLEIMETLFLRYLYCPLTCTASAPLDQKALLLCDFPSKRGLALIREKQWTLPATLRVLCYGDFNTSLFVRGLVLHFTCVAWEGEPIPKIYRHHKDDYFKPLIKEMWQDCRGWWCFYTDLKVLQNVLFDPEILGLWITSGCKIK